MPAATPPTLATPSPTVETHTPDPSAPADSPVTTPSPSPTASPAPAVVESAAFTAPVAPKATATWSGITWRKLKANDPLGTVRSVVRWRGGFVAIGAVIATGLTSRTPGWVSTDGVAWKPLASTVFGPATLVIGVVETKTGLAALTLQGGTNQCGDRGATLDCWQPALPLQTWTSPDGSNWTAHPGPTIDLPVECDSCGVALPLFRSGTPGVLVVNRSHGTERDLALAAFSADGIDWTNLPAKAFPKAFAFGDVEAFRSGFIAVGDNGGEIGRAMALWSTDGRHWQPSFLPTAGLPKESGSTAHLINVGPRGVVVEGGTNNSAPGTTYWWTSTSGTAWRRFSGYPPLGVWNGDGEGSGLVPNGTLLGDGDRLIAYRGDGKLVAWASTNGRSWRSLAISRTRPPATGEWTGLQPILLPIGLILVGGDSSVWYGQPTT